MPVIQASRAASAIGERLASGSRSWRRSRACCFAMSGSGNGMTRKVSVASQIGLPSHCDLRLGHRVAGAVMRQLGGHREHLAGRDEGAELGFLDRREERHAAEIVGARPPASRRSAPSSRSAARRASADGRGNALRRSCCRSGPSPQRVIVRSARSRSTIRSISWKYSSRMDARGVRPPWQRRVRRCGRRGS